MSLELIVTLSQGLIVTTHMITIGYNVARALKRIEKLAPNESAIKDSFAARLNQLCDEAGIPPKFKNRQAQVGKLFGVSQKGARKWLEAEGLPTFEKCIEIALYFNVIVDWLLTGRGAKRASEKPRLAFTREEVAAMRKVAEKASDYVVE